MLIFHTSTLQAFRIELGLKPRSQKLGGWPGRRDGRRHRAALPPLSGHADPPARI